MADSPATRPPLYNIKPPCITLVAVQRTAETKPAAAPYLFPYLPVNGQSPVAKAAPFIKACVERVQEIGKPNILELDDGWTIITEDGSMAAHYENTILITEKEPEILTIL